jgi:hypothetical protein
MSSSHTQIRVSTRVKRILDHRRRADESYNDVLERVLIGTATDSPAETSTESDTRSDPVSLHRKRAKLRRNAWPWRLTTDNIDIDD